MRIQFISSMFLVVGVWASNAVAQVDQRCMSIQTAACNSTLTQCQCAATGRSNESDNVAEQQRRCARDCQEAYQTCVADASRSCYR
jgi:hypothetical protein